MRTISLKIPGSKSITNRALICAAGAKGISIITDALVSDDTKHMMQGLAQLGINIQLRSRKLEVHGGLKKNHTQPVHLLCGNSGTTIRFLAPFLATQKGTFTLDGDARMRKRPIKDLVDALRSLGAEITYEGAEGFPPLTITKPITKTHCIVAGNISSQFLSGLLLAAPLLKKTITISVKGKLVSKPYIDLTIDVMRKFGIVVNRTHYKKFTLQKSKGYRPQKEYTIEGDASSASYFWGISALTKMPIIISNISKNSLQPDKHIEELLQKVVMQKASSIINCSRFPDAAMTLACICAVTKGTWKLTGLETLSIKECDRLVALEKELSKLGCQAHATHDSLTIQGGINFKRKIRIHTYNDHRIAMCFGMLQTIMPNIVIENPDCVQKTFPTFWKKLEQCKKLLDERNIVLIGMRGAGKTSIGAMLQKILNRPCIDLDAACEKKIGMTIRDFVEQKGWEAFRDVEKKMIKTIYTQKKVIIATGGGVVLNSENMQRLRHNGLCIYLYCNLPELTRRLLPDTDRPTVTEGSSIIEELPRLFMERNPLYTAAADIIIDISNKIGDKKKELHTKSRILGALVRFHGIT